MNGRRGTAAASICNHGTASIWVLRVSACVARSSFPAVLACCRACHCPSFSCLFMLSLPSPAAAAARTALLVASSAITYCAFLFSPFLLLPSSAASHCHPACRFCWSTLVLRVGFCYSCTSAGSCGSCSLPCLQVLPPLDRTFAATGLFFCLLRSSCPYLGCLHWVLLELLQTTYSTTEGPGNCWKEKVGCCLPDTTACVYRFLRTFSARKKLFPECLDACMVSWNSSILLGLLPGLTFLPYHRLLEDCLFFPSAVRFAHMVSVLPLPGWVLFSTTSVLHHWVFSWYLHFLPLLRFSAGLCL